MHQAFQVFIRLAYDIFQTIKYVHRLSTPLDTSKCHEKHLAKHSQSSGRCMFAVAKNFQIKYLRDLYSAHQQTYKMETLAGEAIVSGVI